MSHGNAALTPRQRLRLARKVVEEGWSVAAAADYFRVSYPTAAKWSKRLVELGPEGMAAWPRLVATAGVVPHLYGKGAARPGRKMGHANRLIPLGRLDGMTEDEALHGL